VSSRWEKLWVSSVVLLERQKGVVGLVCHNHSVILRMDRQDENVNATDRDVITGLCFASHSISFAPDGPRPRQPHTTASPHHTIQQLLDIKARIPNITIRGELVPVEHHRVDFERRLISFGRAGEKEQLRSFSSPGELRKWRTMRVRKTQAKQRQKGPCPVAPLQGTSI
jgi:hypothetical protein